MTNEWFSSAGFMPHIHCYLGTPSLVWTMFTTDLLIGFAYLSISLSLYLLIRRTQLPFHTVFLAFGLFIFACGATHFMDVYTMWYPEYWLAAFVKIVTAIASVATAVAIIYLKPKVVAFAEAAALSEERSRQLKEQFVLLRKSEEQFRLLVVAIKDYAVLALDPEGRIVTWNEGAKRIKLYEAEEIVGKHFSVFYPPEDSAAGKPAWELKEAISHGRLEDEGWRVRKDGTRFWANVIITPLLDLDGQLIGFSKVTRDLTERKRAEDATKLQNELLEQRVKERTEELKESEAQFRSLADAMPHLAWIARVDGYIFWYNDRWYEYTGTQAKDMEGWGWQSVHEPSELPKVMEKWTASIRSGKSFEMEFPIRGADGVYRWFLSRAVPVHNTRGEIIRWVGTNTNVDDKRKKFELQVNAKVELEKKVKERTIELEVANKELESFSYSVSHDLRAPLRSISGFSGRLLALSRDRLDEEGRDCLSRIMAASQRMGRLIDDLLNLSRVSRAQITHQKIDLSDLADTVNAELQLLEPQREVSVQIHHGLNPINGDPGLIRLILQNLFSNARKYTSKTPSAQIEFGQKQIDNRTTYFIKDNGVGFDMKYVNKLFGAFQRLHSDEEFEGTGIGLATVRRIMHRHGGEVWAEAKPGQGAVFFFTFEPEGNKSHDTNNDLVG